MERVPLLRIYNKSSRPSTLDGEVEWTWDKSFCNNFVDLVNNDRDVKFHGNYSFGTAVVRGNKPLSTDQYFWEIEMISPVYGTDMMIGIGTPEADVSQVHEQFISYLGMNNHTWGLSYTGMFHHDGKSRRYSSRFDQGCIIGVHLDMWNGTLSYYKNKEYLGIATRGLKGKLLYAMASSTAACSGMRIVSSCSFPSSLQFLCCARLRELIPDRKSVLKEIPSPPGLQKFLENNLKWLLDRRCAQMRIIERSSLSLARRRYQSRAGSIANHILFGRNNFDTEEGRMSYLNSNGLTLYVERNSPFILCDYNRFRRNSVEVNIQTHRNCVIEHENSAAEPIDGTNKPGTSLEIQDAASNTPDNFTEASTSGDDNENSIENGAKRRRCSYNYLVGLSDPDSE